VKLKIYKIGLDLATPKLMTTKDKRYVMLIAKRDRFKTCPVVTEEYNLGRENAENVSPTLISKTLKKQLFNGRVAAKKPLLRKANIRKRLEFAKEHVN
jgi:hypothetical protein